METSSLPQPQPRDPFEGWDSVPLFMKSLPPDTQDGQEGGEAIEALKALMYDGTPDEIATNLKEQANEYFKEKKYKEARSFYTQALEQSGDISSEMRRTLLSNRAACNLSLENFRSCLNDCSSVLSTSPLLPSPPSDTLSRKSLFRSSKALIAIKKYEEAIDALEKLEELNQIEGVKDPSIGKLRESIKKSVEEKEKKQRKAKEKKEKEELELKQISEFLKSHSISHPRPLTFSSCPTDIHPPHLTSLDPPVLSLPTFILQPFTPTGPMRDLIISFPTDTTFSSQLAPMAEELGWNLKSMNLFCVTSKGRILKVGKGLTLGEMMIKAKGEGGDGLKLVDGWCLEFTLVGKEREQEWVKSVKEDLKK